MISTSVGAPGKTGRLEKSGPGLLWFALLPLLFILMTCCTVPAPRSGPGQREGPPAGWTRFVFHQPDFYFDYPEDYLKLPPEGYEVLSLASPRLLPRIQVLVIPLAEPTDLDQAARRYLAMLQKKGRRASLVSADPITLTPGVPARLLGIEWEYMGSIRLGSRVISVIVGDKLIYLAVHAGRGAREGDPIMESFSLF
ncbi:MAG: hypothetical protein V1816_09880 [Pseudomonadota bacterium]